MGTRAILTALGICLGCERPAADCEASRFAVSRVDGEPLFFIDLRATAGAPRQRLIVSEPVHPIATPAEGCLASQTVLWTIEGELEEVSYGDASGASVFIDETAEAPLEDGRVYRARVQLIAEDETLSCADDWSISWVQGVPDSVTYCSAWN